MRRLLLVLAACGDGNPCDDVDGTCITLRVSSDEIAAIDQLELDVLYGDTHGTQATQPANGGAVDLPLSTTIALAITAESPVGIVAAGKLGGAVLGTGAASTTIAPDTQASIELVLAPPAVCVAGAYYCGGDKVAGDPETLYQCNGGGVPLARGRCTHGCEVRPTEDDVCLGGPERCEEGGFYCGGNELSGDPRTRYRCGAAGEALAPMECANGCVIAPAGQDDYCR